jgi:hypothetical protein
MADVERNYSIARIEGDVLLHHVAFGWVRAQPGMSFPECIRVTVKTGLDGRAEIINSNGNRFQVPPKTLRVVDGLFSEDDIDTMRFVKVSARDMRAARTSMRLAPAI